jgi:hypothetical protein
MATVQISQGTRSEFGLECGSAQRHQISRVVSLLMVDIASSFRRAHLATHRAHISSMTHAILALQIILNR